MKTNLRQWMIRAMVVLAALGMPIGAALLATGSAAAHSAGAPPATQPAGHAARAHARAARTLKATDTAHLRYVSASGSRLLEEGAAGGTLPGKMRASVSVGATISGSFTIYAKGGTITGHGQATPRGSGVYESFSGTVTVTGGSGRYVHARGHTGLYGTFDRDNYALVIQTTGTLSY